MAAGEIRRIVIDRSVDDGWAWTDAVTGETGRVRCDDRTLEAGDECVVELEREGLAWRAIRWLSAPTHDAVVKPHEAVAPVSALLVNGKPIDFPAERPRVAEVRVGSIHKVFHTMDERSTAERDQGLDQKSRPALVLAIDATTTLVDLSFIYGTNSAVQRNGSGKRIRDWQAAGLRKPSVVSAEVHVRAFDEIGPRIGALSPSDRERLRV